MNIYQRITEGLSGASRALLNTNRSIKKIDMGDENYLKKFKGKVNQMNKQLKAVPQKRVRRKARSTTSHLQGKMALKMERAKRRHGIDTEGRDE